MDNERNEIKKVLTQMAANLATCAATIQALESYAREQGWKSRELLLLHEEATENLRIVFDPLFEAIDKL
jgi:transcriptional regulator